MQGGRIAIHVFTTRAIQSLLDDSQGLIRGPCGVFQAKAHASLAGSCILQLQLGAEALMQIIIVDSCILQQISRIAGLEMSTKLIKGRSRRR